MKSSSVLAGAAIALALPGFSSAFTFGGVAPLRSHVKTSSCAMRRPNAAKKLSITSIRAQSSDTEYASQKLSLAQKEKLYLDCCAAFNVDKSSLVTDDEFEQLKSDLAFEGSKVIMMARDEIKFMVATQRYNEGKPTLSDSEYTALRKELKARNSPAVIFDAPRRKVDGQSGKTVCKADLTADDGKNALLYSPALVLAALLWNEFTFWAYTWDPFLSLIAGSPLVAAVTYVLTNFIYFQNPYITKTQCPKCTSPQNIFFGDVLFVDGGKPGTTVKTACVNKACGCELLADRTTMIVTSTD